MPRSNPRGSPAHLAAVATPAPATAFVEAAGAAGRQVLDRWARDAELARDETRKAAAPNEAAAVQAAWSAELFAQAVQGWTGWLCALLDAQSACWRNAEGWMRDSLQPWQTTMQRPVAIEPLLEPPADASPWALAQRAADTWLALGNAWISALDHDLREADRRRDALRT
jgi:hypothetical protein